MEIRDITGADVELQLIEYLLSIAVALEKLLYTSYKRDTESQHKVSKLLLGIPRASPKARLVSLM